MSADLKPCPFCGGEPSVSVYETQSKWSPSDVPFTQVECDECGIMFASEEGQDPQADDAWNRRTAAWRPIEAARKDRSVIWATFHPRIYPDLEPQRPDLETWNGVQIALRHPGIVQYDDGPFDQGWGVAAPVGQGGFPDRWIVGWLPLSPPPRGNLMTSRQKLARAWAFLALLVAVSAWAGWYAPVGPDGFDQRDFTS